MNPLRREIVEMVARTEDDTNVERRMAAFDAVQAAQAECGVMGHNWWERAVRRHRLPSSMPVGISVCEFCGRLKGDEG